MKNILIKIRDNHEQLFRIFLFLLTLAIIVYVFPRQAKFKYEFTKGKPWMHETIIAPFAGIIGKRGISGSSLGSENTITLTLDDSRKILCDFKNI